MNIKPAQACSGFSMRVLMTKKVVIRIKITGTTGYPRVL